MGRTLVGVAVSNIDRAGSHQLELPFEEHADTLAIDEAVGDPPDGAHDLGGATVLPGLIDAHAHVASDTSRSPGFGPPPLQHGEPPRPAGLAHYILAATADRFLRSGFTTVRDVGAYDDEVLVLRAAIDTGLVPGPRVYTCGRIVSATGPGGQIFRSMYREADGPWEMRKAVREQLALGAEFIKFMATGARSVVLEDPEAPQMTLEEMRAIVDEAHRMGKRVAAHAEGLEGTRWALEAGADTIEHGLALHREPRLLDDMATRGTVLVPTISTFHDLAERFANIFPVVLVEQAKRQLEEAMRTVETARRAGVTLALGYDSGPPGSSAQELLRLMEALYGPERAAMPTAMTLSSRGSTIGWMSCELRWASSSSAACRARARSTPRPARPWRRLRVLDDLWHSY